MNTTVLILAFAFPDLAITETAPAVDLAITETGSFQAWFRETDAAQRADSARKSETPHVAVETPNVCPCGERCECVDCECPGCPHKGKAGRLPRLRVTVWDHGCGRCEAFKAGAMAELGWTVGGPGDQIEIVTVPGNREDSPPAPSFEYIRSDGIESWVGYENRDEFVSKLRRAMDLPFVPKSVRLTHDARPLEAAKPVQTQRTGEHSHLCRSCGFEWWHGGSSRAPQSHNCPNCGAAQYVISRWR